MSAVQRGDEDAFKKLYFSYAPRIHRYLLIHARGQVDVEDVLQETFVTVWRSAASFHGASRVSTWIFGIARHKLMDHLRKLSRLHSRETVLADDLMSTSLDHVDAKLTWSETLAALPLAHRELAHLVFVERMTYQEVSVILKIPVGTVKSRMNHLRSALRELKRQEVET